MPDPYQLPADDGRGDQWMLRAACAGMSPLFDAAADGDPDAIQRAKPVCSTCPVRAECLAYARKHPKANVGVWGGHEFGIRAAKRPPAPCGTDAARRRHYARGEKPCEACMSVRRKDPSVNGSMGDNNINAKLDVEKVREIRERADAGERQADIAVDFDISQGAVSSIIRRTAWAHVS